MVGSGPALSHESIVPWDIMTPRNVGDSKGMKRQAGLGAGLQLVGGLAYAVCNRRAFACAVIFSWVASTVLPGLAAMAEDDPPKAPTADASEATTPVLESGKVLQLSGRAGEVQRFELLTRSPWIDLQLDRQGGLASLRLLDAADRQLIWPRGPDSRFARDWLVWRVDDGEPATPSAVGEEHRFHLEVHFATVGRHLLRIDFPDPSTPTSTGRERGLRRLGARRLFSQAADAFRQGDEASRHRSLALYGKAAEAWKDLGEAEFQAHGLLALGIVQQQLGELEAARRSVDEALRLFRRVDHRHAEASALDLSGVLWRALGEPQRAAADYGQALELHRRLDDACGTARSRLNLGLLEQHAGHPEAARKHFEGALELCPTSEDPLLGAELLVDMAGVQVSLGAPGQAAASLRRAVPKLRRQGKSSHLAAALGNLGSIERQAGNYGAAFAAFHAGLDVARQSGDVRRQGTLLNSLGYAYLRLGEAPRALSFLLEALEMRRRIGEPRGEAVTASNLGRTYAELGKPALARQYYEQSLALRRRIGDRRGEATTLLRWAQVEHLDGRSTEAAVLLARAPQLASEDGDRRGLAQVIFQQGMMRLAEEPDQGSPPWQELLADVEKARRQVAELGDRELLAGGCAVAAALRHRLGESRQAYDLLQQAMDLLEAVRLEVTDADLRASYLAEQRQTYGLAIDVALALHDADPAGAWHLRALQVDERFRARSLLDRMALVGRPAVAESSPQAAALVQRRRQLLRRLQQLEERLADATEVDRGSLRSALERTISDLERLEASLGGLSREREVGEAAAPATHVLSVADMQRQLDDSSLALQLFLDDGHSTLWAIDQRTVQVFQLPPRAELEDLARQLHSAWGTLEMRRDDRQGMLARRLGQALLGPLASRLGDYRRLVLMLDGALHYLPVAALPDPRPQLAGEPLVASFEVVQVPSLSTLARLRERRRALGRDRTVASTGEPSQRIVVLADPVYGENDPRLPTTSGPPLDRAARREAALERLPGSAVEAQAIAVLAPGSRLLIGPAASRQAVQEGALKDADIAHFATHARVDDQLPRLSGLALSRFDATGRPLQGHLALDDIFDLDGCADLVVLSGCRTALGKALGGEGISGLTQGFLQAGASQVVATLWSVQDGASQTLMEHYYRSLIGQGATSAAALRSAQNAMRRQAGWQDPYYWAAFVHLGEWRP